MECQMRYTITQKRMAIGYADDPFEAINIAKQYMNAKILNAQANDAQRLRDAIQKDKNVSIYSTK